MDPSRQQRQAAGLVIFGRPVFYGWWLVFCTFVLMAMASGFFMLGMSAFFLTIREEFTPGRSGPLAFALGIAPLEGAILGPIQGVLVDRFGPRRIMLVGTSFMGAGFILMSTAQSLGVFIGYFIMMASGAGAGMISPALATVAKWFVRRRGIAMGLGMSGFSAGTGLVVLVNFLIESLGWREAAAIIGVVVLGLGLPLAMTFRQEPERYGLLPDGQARPPLAGPPGGRPAPRDEVDFTARQALRTRAFWMLSLGFGFRTMVMSGFTIHFIPAMVDKGYTEATGALMLVFFGLMNTPGRLLVGLLADRLQSRIVATVSIAAVTLAMVALVPASSTWEILAIIGFFAFSMGGSATSYFSLRGEYFGRRAYATIAGFNSMIQGVLGMVATGMAGWLFDRTGDYDVVFLVFGGLAVAGAVSVFAAKRPVLPATV